MIIGYRSVKRTDVTGSVQVRGIASPQTKMMAMADNASADLTNMLAGKAAGLMFEEEMSQEIGQTADDVESGNTPELRTNFAETAFFYPQLRTNEQGEISFSFTMPQSLTRWNFRGYSHTKGMLTGQLDASAVTAKDFMLSPNMPRFVRVGDKTSIAATITNLTGKSLKGTTKFILFDPMTDKVISTQRQAFTVCFPVISTTIGKFVRFHCIGKSDPTLGK